jgi:FkbM family methyltransferase
MSEAMRRAARRILPSQLRSRVHEVRYAIRPATMRVGPGQGLRFDPGPSNSAYASGNNELPVQLAIQERLCQGDVVFDVGANVGFFTIIAARLVGESGHVYAFEPVPKNVRYVRRNTELNRQQNVTIVDKAVAGRSGRGSLVLASYSGGAALATATRPPDATATIDVELVSIDDAIEGALVPPPTLVKIDVEGAELEVLQGMVATLRRHGPTIVCEIDGGERDAFDEKHRACTDFLRSHGYEVTPLADSYPGGDWLVGHFVAVPSPH